MDIDVLDASDVLRESPSQDLVEPIQHLGRALVQAISEVFKTLRPGDNHRQNVAIALELHAPRRLPYAPAFIVPLRRIEHREQGYFIATRDNLSRHLEGDDAAK